LILERKFTYIKQQAEKRNNKADAQIKTFRAKGTWRLGNSSTSLQSEGNLETGKLEYKPSERREPGDWETRVQAFREKGTWRLGN
jgi:hypothetical protein